MIETGSALETNFDILIEQMKKQICTLILSLLGFSCLSQTLAQETALQGSCRKVSVTNVRGVDGLRDAKVISAPTMYAVIVDPSELTLITTNGKNLTAKYRGRDNPKTAQTPGEWSFTDGLDDVRIIFLNKNQTIFNIESKTGKSYYWGSCELVRSPMADQIGTVYAELNRGTNQGRVQRCGVEFGVHIKDHEYNNGQRYYVTGSFGFNTTSDKSVAGYLKVITSKVSALGKPVGEPDRPSNAFLSSGKLNNAKSIVSAQPSDTPGALFSRFELDRTTMAIFSAASDTNQISVVFSRTPGGIDVYAPLDLHVGSVEDQQLGKTNPQLMDQFKECVGDMMLGLK